MRPPTVVLSHPTTRRMAVMSLRPHALEPVPEETARVARAAFPKGNPYLLLRDTLGTIFQDDDFTALFSLVGQPGLPPWRPAVCRSSSPMASRRTRRRC